MSLPDETLKAIEKEIVAFEDRDEVHHNILMAYPEGVPVYISKKTEVPYESIVISAIATAIRLSYAILYKSLRNGTLGRVIVSNTDGNIMIANAGPKAILISIIDEYADMPRLIFYQNSLTKRLSQILA